MCPCPVQCTSALWGRLHKALAASLGSLGQACQCSAVLFLESWLQHSPACNSQARRLAGIQYEVLETERRDHAKDLMLGVAQRLGSLDGVVLVGPQSALLCSQRRAGVWLTAARQLRMCM